MPKSVQQVPEDYIHWFRFSAPYIRKHRGATFVIAIPGEAIEHANFINLVHDLAMLQSLGVRLVIVQGARQQISLALDRAGIGTSISAGVRVSTAAAMPHIIAAANAVRTDLESAMSAGLIDSPMHQLNLKTLSGNFISARPFGVRNGVDYEFTGLVRQVDAEAVTQSLDAGAAVIINTLGYSSTGDVFNLSMFDCLSSIACAINADKIITFMSENHLQPLLNETVIKPGKAQEFDIASGDHRALVNALANSVDQEQVDRAHIVSYEDNGALVKELFTLDGSGLLISRQTFSCIRAAQADDIGAVWELIQPLQESGALVQRTRDLLEQQIQSFAVIDLDGTIVGCAALLPIDKVTAELACVAVHAGFRDRGFASDIVSHLEAQARSMNYRGVFILSTQAGHWFAERGYREATTADLPENRRELYSDQRNSKVRYKPLSPVT